MYKSFALAGVCAIGLSAAPTYAQNASSSQFITKQASDQWRASKLSGIPVYGADNQKIGSVDDVLLDRKGQAKVAVIGIGGFLGVGQKNVGVPFSSLKFTDQAEGRTAASGNSSASSSSSSTSATNVEYPTSATLNATKQQLQNAPSFQYASNANGGASGNSGANANGAAPPAPPASKH